tara:strand:- start:2899 stop:3927 length:1029 start_codon:yes stop_codon:yes gene_type:complete
MNIIDEKGRLFGKINIIDLFVILFLISLTPLLYYGYKIATYTPPKKINIQESYQLIPVEVVFKNLEENIANKIQLNDKEVDKYGKTVAEINKIIKVVSNIVMFENNKKNMMKKIENITTNRKNVFVKMLLNSTIDSNDNVFYKNTPIKDGGEINFSTNKYSIKGNFNLYEEEEEEEEEANTRILLKIEANTIPPVYNLIKSGDKMKTAEHFRGEKSIISYSFKGVYELIKPTDAMKSNDIYSPTFTGKGVASIKSIISVESNKKEFYSLKRDKLIYVDNPDSLKVTLEIDLTCKESNEVCLFDGVPLRVGSLFTFKNEKYQITGNIIEMVKKEEKRYAPKDK